MAVDGGVAMAGEVLGRRNDPSAVVAIDLSRDKVGGQSGVLTHRTNADHRVGGIDVDVRDRTVVLVDTD